MATHKWHFEITDAAREQIRQLDSKTRRLLFRNLRNMLITGHPKELATVRKLVTTDANRWRMRVGVYRVLFTIDALPVTHQKFTYQGTILVEEVLHRKDAY